MATACPFLAALDAYPSSLPSLGVGHNPDSVSSVRGIDTASRNNKRPDFVANGLQISTHLVEFHGDDSNNIFTNDPSGLGFLNNAEHFRPEVTVIILASSLPGLRKGLARESSCEKSATSIAPPPATF
jgi:hypothetical protein